MNCARFLPLIRNALREDIGRRDITTELMIPQNKNIKAVLLAKENCLLCGLDVAKAVFKVRDKGIKFKPLVKDGQEVKKGKILARIEGRARSILTAERVVLNFLSLLCGIATKTKAYVHKVKSYRVKIMDTRKTIPGLRELEKYAVRTGGGYNHRMRLDEMVLVKDNHLAVSGFRVQGSGFRGKIKKIKRKGKKIELEVKNLREFKEALKLKPDIIMLDNMSVGVIRRAVRIRNKPTTNDQRLTTKLEASGNITLKNIRQVAATGVEMISVGNLTRSLESSDISLEVL